MFFVVSSTKDFEFNSYSMRDSTGTNFLNDKEGSQIMAPKNVVLNLFLVKSRTMLVRVQSKKYVDRVRMSTV